MAYLISILILGLSVSLSLADVYPKMYGSNRGEKFKDSKKWELHQIRISHSPSQHIYGIQSVTSEVKNKFRGNRKGKNVTINTRKICITGVNIVAGKKFVTAIQFLGRKGEKTWKSERFGNFNGGKTQSANWNGCLQAFIGRSERVLYKLGFIYKPFPDFGNWNQLGDGWPVSIGGYYKIEVAISCNDGGSCRLFACTNDVLRTGALINNEWETTEDLSSNDYFDSISVSYDGNTFITGARLKDSNAGAVLVFRKSESGWTEMGQVLTGERGDLFGKGVAINGAGDTIVVAARGYNPNYLTIFDFSGEMWITRHKIDMEISYTGEGYPLGLSLDATRLVVGYGFSVDKIDIYSLTTPVRLLQRIVETIDNGYGTSFGGSVAISADGQVVAVGADGYAKIFRATDDDLNRYAQVGNKLVGSEEDEYFGHSVALSADGEKLAVQAEVGQINVDRRGRTYIFATNDIDDHELIGKILGEPTGNFSGVARGSVFLSSDGRRVAIFANSSDGVVRVYEYSEYPSSAI